MKFLLDSCISKFALEALKKSGHDVVWMPDLGNDPGDDIIIKKALDESRILVTADKDFGELVYVFNMPHDTIIRLVDIPAKEQGNILLMLIETHKDVLNKKALITLDRYRVRTRLGEADE